jgi:Fe2+ or Zn2+ uptake regulation protein
MLLTTIYYSDIHTASKSKQLFQKVQSSHEKDITPTQTLQIKCMSGEHKNINTYSLYNDSQNNKFLSSFDTVYWTNHNHIESTLTKY